MPGSENGFYVGTKIPQPLKISVCDAVKNGDYLNISDFIRAAIRERLERERLRQVATGR